MFRFKLKFFIKKSKFENVREFSISRSHQVLPQFVWVMAKPIAKLGAIIFGRSIRKWWQKLPQVKRTVFVNHLKRNVKIYCLIGAGSTTAATGLYHTCVEEHPITNRKRFMLFSLEQLVEIENHGINKVLS